jgi:hypothetical protein
VLVVNVFGFNAGSGLRSRDLCSTCYRFQVSHLFFVPSTFFRVLSSLKLRRRAFMNELEAEQGVVGKAV